MPLLISNCAVLAVLKKSKDKIRGPNKSIIVCFRESSHPKPKAEQAIMSTKYTVVPTPQSNEELKQWIQDWIGFVNEASNETLGVSGTTLRKPKRDHGHPSTWNTELITDMSDLFFRNEWGDTTFNEDISSWDTSNVINMRAVRPVEKDNVSKQTHQHLHFHYSFHNYSFHTIHS